MDERTEQGRRFLMGYRDDDTTEFVSDQEKKLPQPPLCKAPMGGERTVLPRDFSALPEIQRAILSNSARYVKAGGLLVYSTCTILPEENERVTDDFLSAHPEFTYESFSLPNGEYVPGHITLWPQRSNTDGFYLSRMRRRTHD